MTVDAFAVALSTVFDPSAARGLDASVVVDLEGDRIVARVHDGQLEVTRGQAEQPEARIETSIAALREVLWRGRPLADAEADEQPGRARTAHRGTPVPHALPATCSDANVELSTPRSSPR